MESEWEELFNKKHQRKYWKNKSTGETSWKDPNKDNNKASSSSVTNNNETTNQESASVAPTSSINKDEWTELYSEKHKRKYWKHKDSGKTSWKSPEEMAKAQVGNDEKDAASVDPSLAQASVATPKSSSNNDWTELFSEKHQKRYWKNKTTGKTSWTPPTATETTVEKKVTPESETKPAENSEWEELYSEKHKKKYWKNKSTGKTSWTPPPAPTVNESENKLASASADQTTTQADQWEELYSEKHKRKYWKNKATGKTSWTKPVEELKPVETSTAKEIPAATETKATNEDNNWVECYHEKHKRKYWKNNVTGKSTWNNPYLNANVSGGNSVVSALTTATTVPIITQEKINKKNNIFQILLQKNQFLYLDIQKKILKHYQINNFVLFSEKVFTNPDKFELSNEETTVEEYNILNIEHIICNRIHAQVFLKFNSNQTKVSTDEKKEGENFAPFLGNNSSTITSPELTLIFFTSQHAYLFLLHLQSILQPLSSGSEESKLSFKIEDFTGPSRLTKVSSLSDIISSGLDLVPYSPQYLLLEAFLTRVDLDRIKNLPNISNKENQLVSEIEDNKHMLASQQTSSLENISPIIPPMNGILVVKVFQDENTHISTPFLPCWLQVDLANKCLSFYEFGPEQSPSFTLDCHQAILQLPDVSTIQSDHIEVYLQHLQLTNVENNKNTMQFQIGFLFKSLHEMKRWLITLANVSTTVTFIHSDHVEENISMAIIEPNSGLIIPSNNNASTTIQPIITLSSTLSLPCLQLLVRFESALINREIYSYYYRQIQCKGNQLKSYKFQSINNYIVVTQVLDTSNNSSRKQELSILEGSIILSINGLSALQLPNNILLKFIHDLPKQMIVDLTFLQFPRCQFSSQCIQIDDPQLIQTQENQTISSQSPNNPSKDMMAPSMAQSATNLKKLDNGATNQLNRMIARKKSISLIQPIILQVNEGKLDDQTLVQTINTEIEKNLLNKPSYNVAMESFRTSDSLPMLPWTDFQIEIKNMLIYFTPILTSTDQNVSSQSSSPLVINPSTCNLKLITHKSIKSISDILIDLQDNQNHLILKPLSTNHFQKLLRHLLLVMKFCGSTHQLDFSWIYNQGLKLHGHSVVEPNVDLNPSVVNIDDKLTQLISSSGILSQLAIQSESKHNYDDSNHQEKSEFVDLALGLTGEDLIPLQNNQPNYDIYDKPQYSLLQAARDLEETLSQLNLPSIFPTIPTIEQEVKEIRDLARGNMQLLGDVLSTQSSIMISYPETSSNNNNLPFFNSAPNGSVAASIFAAEESSQNTGLQLEDLHDVQSVNTDDIPLHTTPAPPQQQRRASFNSNIPSPLPTTSTGSASRRASVKLSVVTPTPTGLGSFKFDSNRDSKQFHLSTEENKAFAIIFRELRSHPNLWTSLTNKLTSQQDLLTFAYILTQRFYGPWSQDITSFENLIEILIAHSTSKTHSVNPLAAIMNARTDTTTSQNIDRDKLLSLNEDSSNNSNAKSIGFFQTFPEFLQTLIIRRQHTSKSSTYNSSASTLSNYDPLLLAILYEISCRADVIGFFFQITSQELIQVTNSFTLTTPVVELCTKLLEPLTKRLYSLIEAQECPKALASICRLLSTHHNTIGIQSKDYLASCFVPYFTTILVIHNSLSLSKEVSNNDSASFDMNFGHNNTQSRSPRNEETLLIIVQRIQDLLYQLFDQEHGDSFSTLSLSDIAALSRSKWLLNKSIDQLLSSQQFGDSLVSLQYNSSPKDSSNSLSPIGQLTCLHPLTGMIKAAESYLTLRPSELLFVIQILDLTTFSTSAFLINSKQVSDALQFLQHTHVYNRFLQLNPIHLSYSKRSYLFSSLDKEQSFVFDVYDNNMSEASQDDAWLDALLLSEQNNRGNLNSTDVDQLGGELNAIQWLISAARLSLKRVYDLPEQSSKQWNNHALITELADLRTHLQEKSNVISACLLDYKQLFVNKEILSLNRAQLILLLDLYKGNSQFLPSNQNSNFNGSLGSSLNKQMANMTSTLSKNSNSLSQSNSGYESLYCPLLLSISRLPVPDSSYFASNNNSNSTLGQYKGIIFDNPSDEEKESILSKLMINIWDQEAILQRNKFSVHLSNIGSNSYDNDFSLSQGLFLGHSQSAKSSLTYFPATTPSKASIQGSFVAPSASLLTPSFPSQDINPLWVIMQNVFTKH